MTRKTHWEDIYRDKSPLEVSWFQREPALSLQLITNTGALFKGLNFNAFYGIVENLGKISEKRRKEFLATARCKWSDAKN